MTNLPLRTWAELLTREVRARLPDVRATGSRSSVTWTRGQRSARLSAEPGIWWLTFGKGRTYCEWPDAHSAHVAASNIVVHFDARWCRGIDVEPYSEAYRGRAAAPTIDARSLGTP
jgi:hypothetical protein